MKKIYKLLIPQFRESEIDIKINNEWDIDSYGSEGMNF